MKDSIKTESSGSFIEAHSTLLSVLQHKLKSPFQFKLQSAKLITHIKQGLYKLTKVKETNINKEVQ